MSLESLLECRRSVKASRERGLDRQLDEIIQSSLEGTKANTPHAFLCLRASSEGILTNLGEYRIFVEMSFNYED